MTTARLGTVATGTPVHRVVTAGPMVTARVLPGSVPVTATVLVAMAGRIEAIAAPVVPDVMATTGVTVRIDPTTAAADSPDATDVPAATVVAPTAEVTPVAVGRSAAATSGRIVAATIGPANAAAATVVRATAVRVRPDVIVMPTPARATPAPTVPVKTAPRSRIFPMT